MVNLIIIVHDKHFEDCLEVGARLGTMRASRRHHCITVLPPPVEDVYSLQRHDTGISGALVCQHEVSDEEAKTRVGDTNTSNTSNLLVRPSATMSCVARGSLLASGLERGLGEAYWYTYQMSLVGFM